MCGVHVCCCTLSTSHPDLVYLLFVPALSFVSSLFLWSVMIVECILCCRLVHMHAKNLMAYCISLFLVCRCISVVYNYVFTLLLYEAQCSSNIHLPTALWYVVRFIAVCVCQCFL